MSENSKRIAAIDMGTVTMRLLVADVDATSVNPVLKVSRIVNLGEGVALSGLLCDAALERVERTAAEFEGLLASMDPLPERLVVLATSAARDAGNVSRLEGILAARGFSLAVISGDREASLSFAGAASSFAGEGILVSDVGGGSTELILGDLTADAGARIEKSVSYNVGARRVTELFLHDDPPSREQVLQAGEWASQQIAPFFAGDGAARAKRLVSVAGTATTLVAIGKGMEVYDAAKVHGSVLTLEQVDGLIEHFCSLSLEERASVPGLSPQRASIIIGGSLVQREVMRVSGFDVCTVSTTAILEGIMRAVFAGEL